MVKVRLRPHPPFGRHTRLLAHQWHHRKLVQPLVPAWRALSEPHLDSATVAPWKPTLSGIYPAVDYQCTCAGGVQLWLKIWPDCLSNNTSGPLSYPTVSSPHPPQQAPVALCILQCQRYGAVLCLQRREETLTYSSLKLMPSAAKLLKNPKSARPAPVISPKINDNVVPQCSTVYLLLGYVGTCSTSVIHCGFIHY